MENGMKYSVNFINHSSNQNYVFMYQKDPDIQDPDIMSLAWFSQYSYPTTKHKFSWEINYDFVWGQTGILIPGVYFDASQEWDADLTNLNSITLNYDPVNKAYNFENLAHSGKQGSLYIKESGSLPLKQASVGIGMSGAGTFVKQAQPNMNLVFTPHPVYYIAFGNHTQGEVLDINEITNSAKIEFPPNTYSMTATLEEDNTWTILPTQKVNEMFIETKGHKPWGAIA